MTATNSSSNLSSGISSVDLPLMSPRSICVIGCGTLGKVILGGLRTSTAADSQEGDGSFSLDIHACVARQCSSEALSQEFPDIFVYYGGKESNTYACKEADTILLCVKPFQVATVLGAPGMREALEGKLVISIAAGVSCDALALMLPLTCRVIRAMPNTPCQINEGMTVLSVRPNKVFNERNMAIAKQDLEFATRVFSGIGKVMVLDECHMDAVTAISGSGPAFACVVLESITDAGLRLGLPRKVALTLAAQTLQGASRMVLNCDDHPAVLRDRVTTPGGCTIAGLVAMEQAGVRHALITGVLEAASACKNLAQKK